MSRAGDVVVGAPAGVREDRLSGALYPKLKPRRGASPEAVAADQLARLHGAMIEVCARYGYAEISVRNLVGLAGVSSKTFYKHYPDGETCFLATYDEVVEGAVARISAAYRDTARGGGHDWTAGLCRAFDAFVDELLERPEASRLALVDVLVIGPTAFERIERVEAVFVEMIAASLARASRPLVLPPLILRSLVGGIWFVARRRLLEGRPALVSGYGEELLGWLLVYLDPSVGELRGGLPRAGWRLGKRSLERFPSDSRSRMLRAAAQIACERGFGALGEGAICERAVVGRAEFEAEFDDACGCFLVSLQMLSAQALARAIADSREAGRWESAVCLAVRSFLCQLAADPVLARVVFIESYEAGPVGAEQCAALVEAFAAVLVRRSPSDRRPTAVAAEAIVGAVWSIVHRYVIAGRVEQLPALSAHIAYLVLAPAIGAEAACEAIVAERDALRTVTVS